MATQRLSMGEAIWTRTRRKAFDLGISASQLAETALTEYLDRMDKPPARLATARSPRPLDPGPMPWDPPVESLVPEAAVPVIEQELYLDAEGRRQIREVKLIETSIVADPLPGHEFTIVNDPEEAARVIAAKVEAQLRPFTPVPKPVRKTRPKR